MELSPAAVMLKSQVLLLLPLISARGKMDPELEKWLSSIYSDLFRKMFLQQQNSKTATKKGHTGKGA